MWSSTLMDVSSHSLYYTYNAGVFALPDSSNSSSHQENYRLEVRVTDLRKTPMYSMITNWLKLLCMGLFPFSLVGYINFKVFSLWLE